MNFTAREFSAASLSTQTSLAAYTPGMSEGLRSFLAAERGRATRLADALGISRSYVSDIAAGKKMPSLPLLKRIAQETGLTLEDLAGKSYEMSESDAAPYQPGPKSNRLKDLAVMLYPAGRHPSYFIAGRDQVAFGILEGDLLVTDAKFDPDRIELGKTVVANTTQDMPDGRTVIARVATPWLIDASGRIVGELWKSASILGLVNVVLRSADPAAF